MRAVRRREGRNARVSRVGKIALLRIWLRCSSSVHSSNLGELLVSKRRRRLIHGSIVGRVPFEANPDTANVIHHQRDTQPLKPLRDPLIIDIWPISIRHEIPHITTVTTRTGPRSSTRGSRSRTRTRGRGRRGGRASLQLLNHRKDLSLVPPMDDQVEPLIIQLPRQSLPDPIRRTGDQRVRRARTATGEVLPIPIRGTEELEPDEIEQAFEVVETEEETDDGE